MNKIIFCAFVIFISQFLFNINICDSAETSEYEFFFEGIEGEKASTYANYEVEVKKINSTTFSVFGDIKQNVEIGKDMEIEILTFHATERDGKLEPFYIKYPKNGVCVFLKGPYEKYIYPNVEKTSNFPHPDTCPLPIKDYQIKEYIFNAEKYKKYAKPGKWEIELKLYKGPEAVFDMKILAFVEEKKV